MRARRDVFQAIADPTRREIINLIAAKPQNVNEIAQNFKVSRQAISLHIKILEECGLISLRQLGRERFCQPQLTQLHEVSVWIDRYRQHFENKLDSLENYLDTLQQNKGNGKQKR